MKKIVKQTLRGLGSTSGSVMRVLVMWVCTPLLRCRVQGHIQGQQRLLNGCCVADQAGQACAIRIKNKLFCSCHARCFPGHYCCNPIHRGMDASLSARVLIMDQGLPAMPGGPCACTSCYGLIVAHARIPKRQIVHAPLRHQIPSRHALSKTHRSNLCCLYHQRLHFTCSCS